MIIGDSVIFVGGGESATIVVTAPTGSTVTLTKPDSTTVTGTETSGTWTFKADAYGSYTLTATKNGQTATQVVVVDAATTYNVTLSFTVRITISDQTGTAKAYVVWNETEYNTSFDIPTGDSIMFRTYASTRDHRSEATITLNGMSVGVISSEVIGSRLVGQTYTFSPASALNVSLSSLSSAGVIVATGGV